VDFEEKE
jgi:hypothetical protein